MEIKSIGSKISKRLDREECDERLTELKSDETLISKFPAIESMLLWPEII